VADFGIDPPPLYPPLIAGALRNARYADAPAAPDFDANLAQAKVAESHREMMMGWGRLAAQGHPGAQAVIAYHGGTPLPAPQPVAPPAQSKAVTPQAPRAAATPVAPSVALSGLDRRVALLQRLVNPPKPPADLF
jgi:hypothetical protein